MFSQWIVVFRKRMLIVISMCLLLSATSALAEDMVNVNVAKPEWGTRITATTEFSEKYPAANLADGEIDGPHCWFGKDGATLPQHVVFAFADTQKITGLKAVQVNWNGQEYRCKEFAVETSTDGQTWKKLADGALKIEAGATCVLTFDPVETKWLRVVLTNSFDTYRTSGLAEVEIYSPKPAGTKPPYAGASRDLRWDVFGRHVLMQLELDPPAAVWLPDTKSTPEKQIWNSPPYHLEIIAKEHSALSKVFEYALTRTDNEPFHVRKNRVEIKSSYAGVYKIFTPNTMAQQNYRIDLPFRIDGACRAEVESPVIWMQETSGNNTFTAGMLNQVPLTHLEGSTYDTGNGGEAPGIANSYARIGFVRQPQHVEPVRAFKDGLYVSADTAISWYDTLIDYAGAVDSWRSFTPKPVGKNALRSMWHSWYAHADKIDQVQLLDDAEHAAPLGIQALEIDAGWNLPPGVGYSFDVEGDYDFDTGRFPDTAAMVNRMHELGLTVILHVAPLIMGKQAKSYSDMKDCMLNVGGKPTSSLDPRLVKTRDYLVNAWDKLLRTYKMDGLWYDFLELADDADPTPAGMPTISTNLHEAYTMLMRQLYEKTMAVNPNAVIILRRGSANLNAKTYATHVWPMDTPQDYNMNRRDIVYLKTFGDGVTTHACCTSWPISESDENVARQMASITMAGVPAFSVKLAESPESHNAIIRAWLKFYDTYKQDLVLGHMTPLLPTPPSAAIQIEGKDQAFFGFFEAVPGLVQLTKPAQKIVVVNAFSKRLVTRIEGVTGDYKYEVFDQAWKPCSSGTLKNENNGVNIDVSAQTRCFTVVVEKTP